MLGGLSRFIVPKSKPQGPRTLRQGMSGLDVARVQNQLNRALAGSLPPLWVDGMFGPKTNSHVRTFQMRHGLTVDGIVGPETRGRLETYTR